MTTRYLEDYTDGEEIVCGAFTLERGDLISFAERYDAQPMHIDEDYAKTTGPFGDVIASGFQTVAIAFKLFQEMGFFEGDVALGGPGMDEVRWLKPVFPGDVLTNHATVLEARRSRSKPDRGIIRVKHDLRNQSGDSVVTCITTSMIRCRDLPAG